MSGEGEEAGTRARGLGRRRVERRERERGAVAEGPGEAGEEEGFRQPPHRSPGVYRLGAAVTGGERGF